MVVCFGLVLLLLACSFPAQQSIALSSPSVSTMKGTDGFTPTASFAQVLTHTPQSYPSSLQGWLLGTWQQVSSGVPYRFTDDFQLIVEADPPQTLGYYRFVSENEVLIPWNHEMVQVEIWQLDQNSLLLNFPDGLGDKFIRVSP